MEKIGDKVKVVYEELDEKSLVMKRVAKECIITSLDVRDGIITQKVVFSDGPSMVSCSIAHDTMDGNAKKNRFQPVRGNDYEN